MCHFVQNRHLENAFDKSEMKIGFKDIATSPTVKVLTKLHLCTYEMQNPFNKIVSIHWIWCR